MNDALTQTKRFRTYAFLEVALIIALASVPLFTSFPYRVNIFLSWEGAYRLSQGQVPYKDFGMPLGYMYWTVPALFFKIFGPQMITLVKAQVFLNILSGLAFRSILKSLSVQPGLRLVAVLLYCLSYSFFNFWPWYNHTVIVYQVIGLAFLLKYITGPYKKYNWIWLSLSALFVFFSFFTKQDGGGLALMLCCALLLYHCFYEKKWIPLLVYIGSFVLIAFAIILPLTKFNFGYWFNHGQPPHTARVSFFEIIDEFFYRSEWIKFYLFLILLLVLGSFKKFTTILKDKKATLFLLLTLGILAEAAILQITSYTPPDNNIFFHSFAITFILSFLTNLLPLHFSSIKTVALCTFGICIWWSGTYWKYTQRILSRAKPAREQIAVAGENVVNRKTYMINKDTGIIPTSQWVYSGLKTFNRIYMPKPTVDGMHRLLNMEIVKQNKNLKVLNMSELTPLAAEMPFRLQTGPDVPLWYHLGVSMFNQDAERLEKQIAACAYDLVLFEYIPSLNNFYPFRVRDSLMVHYQKIDSFYAPRAGDTNGNIEVYVKPAAKP